MRMIFVNMPVKNLARSRAFFDGLGFSFNEQFSNESGACMVIEENIFAMLLTEPFFDTFLTQPMSDAHKATEVLTCLSAASRAEVDRTADKALAGGAKSWRDPQDHGWMFSRSFQDLDGHVWELAFMDASALPGQP